ncbi:hypothetical protein As57867_007235, partial [Aphanomyces stellatus]
DTTTPLTTKPKTPSTTTKGGKTTTLAPISFNRTKGNMTNSTNSTRGNSTKGNGTRGDTIVAPEPTEPETDAPEPRLQKSAGVSITISVCLMAMAWAAIV